MANGLRYNTKSALLTGDRNKGNLAVNHRKPCENAVDEIWTLYIGLVFMNVAYVPYIDTLNCLYQY